MNEKQTLSISSSWRHSVEHPIPSDSVVMRMGQQLDSYMFGDLQTNENNCGTRSDLWLHQKRRNWMAPDHGMFQQETNSSLVGPGGHLSHWLTM